MKILFHFKDRCLQIIVLDQMGKQWFRQLANTSEERKKHRGKVRMVSLKK